MRHRAIAAGLVMLAGAAGGCTVGEGTGEARGQLFVLSCKRGGEDLGSPTEPAEYSLDPEFFAGEPHGDIGTSLVKANRLIIRVQTTGRRRELTDVLTVDVVNSYEVARCVRGRQENGKPDYDPKNCSWETGKPRLRVGTDAHVRVYFTPRATCPGPDPTRPTNAVATAVSEEGRWVSWITFLSFGAARAEPDVPPGERPTTAPDFRVDFGQRLHAERFELELRDDKVVKGLRPNAMPEIGGALAGFFDFDLERGQGAQTFP